MKSRYQHGLITGLIGWLEKMIVVYDYFKTSSTQYPYLSGLQLFHIKCSACGISKGIALMLPHICFIMTSSFTSDVINPSLLVVLTELGAGCWKKYEKRLYTYKTEAFASLAFCLFDVYNGPETNRVGYAEDRICRITNEKRSKWRLDKNMALYLL